MKLLHDISPNRIDHEVELQEIYLQLQRIVNSLALYYHSLNELEFGDTEDVLQMVRRVRVKFNRAYGYRSK